MLLSKKRPDKLVALIVLASLILIAIVALVMSIEIAQAQTQPARPMVTTFTYRDAYENNLTVATWRQDRVQCSAVTRGNAAGGAGISCVLMP